MVDSKMLSVRKATGNQVKFTRKLRAPSQVSAQLKSEFAMQFANGYALPMNSALLLRPLGMESFRPFLWFLLRLKSVSSAVFWYFNTALFSRLTVVETSQKIFQRIQWYSPQSKVMLLSVKDAGK